MYENLQENETVNVSPENPVNGFVCLKCGIALEEWRELLIGTDGEVSARGEYEFKFCPECGRKVVEHLD